MKDVVTAMRQLRQKAPHSEHERSSLCPSEGSWPYMEILRKSHTGCGGGGWAQRFIISLGPAQTLSTPSACRKMFLISTTSFCQPREREREREQGQRKVGGGGALLRRWGSRPQVLKSQENGQLLEAEKRQAKEDGKRNRRGLTYGIPFSVSGAEVMGKGKMSPTSKCHKNKKRKNKQNVIRPSKGRRGIRTHEERAAPGTGSPMEASVPATP